VARLPWRHDAGRDSIQLVSVPAIAKAKHTRGKRLKIISRTSRNDVPKLGNDAQVEPPIYLDSLRDTSLLQFEHHQTFHDVQIVKGIAVAVNKNFTATASSQVCSPCEFIAYR
jgi:hypothetical protein